jgi:hypothetical protein
MTDAATRRRPPRPIRIGWWEFVLAIPLVLVALLFVAGSHFASALVVFAVLALLLIWRAEVVERNLPGGYARVRGWMLITQWFAMASIYAVLLGIFWIANRDHWSKDRQGIVAVYASAGLAFFLAGEMIKRGDDALDWLQGSDAEVKVANVLNGFRERDWDVVHDVKKDHSGNVDHLVLARHIAFAVETKSGRESSRARGQALSNAAWAKEKYGRRWVNAVLCVLKDPPDEPKKVGQAWVTGINDLQPLLARLAGLR